MKVAAACHQNNVRMVIVDRYSKSDAPEDLMIYSQPDNVLDFGGGINRAYGIAVYPSFVLIDQAGTIAMKDVGGNKATVDGFFDYLCEQFRVLLPD